MIDYRAVFEHTDLAVLVLWYAPTRANMCSVNKYFAKYCIELSKKLSQAPHLYEDDAHTLTLSDRDAILADYHLYVRIKPKYKISAYTAFVIGCTEVAIDVLLRQNKINGVNTSPAMTNTDVTIISKLIGAALRGGNIKLAEYLRQATIAPNYKIAVDAARGGHISAVSYVCETMYETVPLHSLSCMFGIACEYGKIQLVRYLHEKLLAVKEETNSKPRFFCCGAAVSDVVPNDMTNYTGAMGVGRTVSIGNDMVNCDYMVTPYNNDVTPTTSIRADELGYSRLLDLYETAAIAICRKGSVETLSEIMKYLMELDAEHGYKYVETCGLSPRAFHVCLQAIYQRDNVEFFLQVKAMMGAVNPVMGAVHVADGFPNACSYGGINIVNYIISQGLENMSAEAKAKYKDTLAIGTYDADTSLIVYCITWIIARWDTAVTKSFIEKHKHELTLEDLNLCLKTACGLLNYDIMEYLVSLGAYHCAGCDRMISDHLPFR